MKKQGKPANLFHVFTLTNLLLRACCKTTCVICNSQQILIGPDDTKNHSVQLENIRMLFRHESLGVWLHSIIYYVNYFWIKQVIT